MQKGTSLLANLTITEKGKQDIKQLFNLLTVFVNTFRKNQNAKEIRFYISESITNVVFIIIKWEKNPEEASDIEEILKSELEDSGYLDEKSWYHIKDLTELLIDPQKDGS
jgi:hypothetical protein